MILGVQGCDTVDEIDSGIEIILFVVVNCIFVPILFSHCILLSKPTVRIHPKPLEIKFEVDTKGHRRRSEWP